MSPFFFHGISISKGANDKKKAVGANQFTVQHLFNEKENGQ